MKFKFSINKISKIFNSKKRKDKEHFSVYDCIVESDKKNNQDDFVYSDNKILKNKNTIDKNDINYYYNIIINTVSKKITKNEIDSISFSDYVNEKKNPILLKKVEKYLQKYFKSKRIFARLFNKYPFEINKTYGKLNYYVSKIERIAGPIFTYDKFISYGNNAYNFEKDIIEENKELTNKQEDLKVKKETKKKDIIKTPELEELKTNKRKLLYKIRKMDQLLKETKEQILECKENENNISFMNKKILRDKETILETEKMMYETKINDERFKSQIENSINIRKQNSINSLETYFRRVKNGKIKESLEDYFGQEQLLYFQNLGIDLNSFIVEKNK